MSANPAIKAAQQTAQTLRAEAGRWIAREKAAAQRIMNAARQQQARALREVKVQRAENMKKIQAMNRELLKQIKSQTTKESQALAKFESDVKREQSQVLKNFPSSVS